jgi:hypothetical protein
MNKLNIITPCTRPENLKRISESINIPTEHYRWIVVFDMDKVNPELIPDNCEYHYYRNPESKVGNDQRNYALDFIKDGKVYFLDDDTLFHPELWDSVKNYDNDFISFAQSDKNNNIRVTGQKIMVNHIDSGCVVLSRELIGNTRWNKELYNADGVFFVENYNKSKTYGYIQKVLSIYNQLRNE